MCAQLKLHLGCVRFSKDFIRAPYELIRSPRNIVEEDITGPQALVRFRIILSQAYGNSYENR